MRARVGVALTALACSGFTFMALEILFLRELQITLGGTLYASSATLASVMLGLFLGSQLFGRLSRNSPDIGAVFLRLELALAAAAAATIPALRALGTAEPWPLRYAASFAVILVPSALAGGELPVAMQFLEPAIAPGETGFATGLVYGADTLGALLGALVLPFLLLPHLGAWRSALLAAAMTLAAALPLWIFASRAKRGAALVGGALAAILVAGLGRTGAAFDLRTAGWVVPPPIPQLKLSLSQDTPYQRIQLFGDLRGAASDASPRVLVLDGVVENSVPTHPRFRESVLLGLVSHPDPRSVLVIGCGDGDFLQAVLTDPRVQRLTQVEIDPAVIRTAVVFLKEGGASTPAFWQDRRLRVRIGDGRRFLDEARERYDLILSDLPHAAHEGAAAFYSAEFFKLAASRLNPGGIFMTHVYRPDEDAPGGRAKAVAALAIAARTAREAFYEVRVLSPFLRPAGADEDWAPHWLIASQSPLGASPADAARRLAKLDPKPGWLTPGAYSDAWRGAVDLGGYEGWPVS
ncbi:MAG: hypothetical protein NTX64_10315, partial [Elusimicrobia bacterium]|nr:hypothetical protein [Elusimicrobiota bacterium]